MTRFSLHMLHHYDPRIFFLVTLMSADQQLYTSIVNTAVKLQIIAFASLILGWSCIQRSMTT